MSHDENCLCGDCRPGFGNPNDHELQACKEEQEQWLDVYAIVLTTDEGPEIAEIHTDHERAGTVVRQLRKMLDRKFMHSVKDVEVVVVDIGDVVRAAVAEHFADKEKEREAA